MTTLTRERCVDRLRRELMRLAGDEHSACEVASRKQVFCRGFSQWSWDELKQRYAWIIERWPHIKRPELERLADIWQVARAEVLGTPTACDTQTMEHDCCKGWDEWSDEELAGFLAELSGEPVVIRDETR